MKRITIYMSISFLILSNFLSNSTKCQTATSTINVDLNKPIGNMNQLWAWFGYDEPNYTYMKDGKKLLSEIAALSPVPVYVRTHSLLSTGDGIPALKWGSTNAYTEDANGNPIYSWRIIDSIFDTYIQRGMKPLAQIGFMPEAMSTHPQPYKHNWQPGMPYDKIITGWAYPPKDYKKWGDLVYEWVKHSVQRYGKKEVESWYWEVWNEPNSNYWKGTQQEYFKLYDYAADGLKRALPTAKIGGADVTGGGTRFLHAFISHCLYDTNYATAKIGSPLEVVLFHAKGSPKLINDKVVMNVKQQLSNIDDELKMITGFKELKNIPIIIGESDPEGCAACGMATNPSNAYRNGTMYSSYTAASFARKYQLADKYNANLIGAVTWAFEFENQPWFYGYRDLATNGVDKPVLNVFRMFGMMQGKRVEVKASNMYSLKNILDSSVRGQTDIGAIAAKDGNSATLMVWNYHDADKLKDTSDVKITITGLPGKKITMTEYRIDQSHSNSYEVWKKMGSPQYPTHDQINWLKGSGHLSIYPIDYEYVGLRKITENIHLPRQAVYFFKLTW